MRQAQQRLAVAVLDATGMVGQRFIELLQGHPWFELVAVAASDQHGGRPYAEVARWRLPGSDRDAGWAMGVTIGRLRRCPILSYKFVLLGHNTIRGAAGGSILSAELGAGKGLL